ncbi:hypothetical protein Vpro01_00866 [Vibrio proteolyticus]
MEHSMLTVSRGTKLISVRTTMAVVWNSKSSPHTRRRFYESNNESMVAQQRTLLYQLI